MNNIIDKDFINGKIRDIGNSINELLRLTLKNFKDMNIDEVYSMRYQIIVLVEAIISLCSHIALEVYNYEPSSYKDCITYICNREGIKCVKDLKSIISLRNLLIHRYWIIEDNQIYNSIKKNFKCIEEFLNKIIDKYG